MGEEEQRPKIETEKPRPTFYDALGVQKDISPEDLKKEYRKLARILHPDANPTTDAKLKEEREERFKAVTEAYDTLSDSDKRQKYDRWLQWQSSPSHGAPPPDLSDLFASFNDISDRLMDLIFEHGVSGYTLIEEMREAMTARRDQIVQERLAADAEYQQLKRLSEALSSDDPKYAGMTAEQIREMVMKEGAETHLTKTPELDPSEHTENNSG